MIVHSRCRRLADILRTLWDASIVKVIGYHRGDSDIGRHVYCLVLFNGQLAGCLQTDNLTGFRRHCAR